MHMFDKFVIHLYVFCYLLDRNDTASIVIAVQLWKRDNDSSCCTFSMLARTSLFSLDFVDALENKNKGQSLKLEFGQVIICTCFFLEEVLIYN